MASPQFRLALAMMAGSKTGETTAEMAVMMTAAMIDVMTVEAIVTTAVMIAETTDVVVLITKMRVTVSRLRLPGKSKRLGTMTGMTTLQKMLRTWFSSPSKMTSAANAGSPERSTQSFPLCRSTWTGQTSPSPGEIGRASCRERVSSPV